MRLFKKRAAPNEYIGETWRALHELSKCPGACLRMAQALEIPNDDGEAADFVRQQAENEARRARAEQYEGWANDARKRVTP